MTLSQKGSPLSVTKSRLSVANPTNSTLTFLFLLTVNFVFRLWLTFVMDLFLFLLVSMILVPSMINIQDVRRNNLQLYGSIVISFFIFTITIISTEILLKLCPCYNRQRQINLIFCPGEGWILQFPFSTEG